MKNARLRDSYNISRVIKGNWQLSDSHSEGIASKRSLDDLYKFLETGIYTFDMADIYTGIEDLFGEFRNYAKAKNIELASKIKIHTKYVPDRSKLANISFKDTERIVDRSLKRLNMETLDLVQFHWWDYEVGNYLEVLGHLFTLRDKGKIKHVGLTNFNSSRIQEIVDSGFDPVSIQIQYSVLDQRAKHYLESICIENNIKFLCYGVLAGGFLSEKWLGTEDPSMKGSIENRSLIKYRVIIEEIGGWNAFQDILKELDYIAKKNNCSIGVIAGAYILAQQNVEAIIIGSRNTKHIDTTLRMANIALSNEELEQIDNLVHKYAIKNSDFYELERYSKQHSSIMKYDLNKAKYDKF